MTLLTLSLSLQLDLMENGKSCAVKTASEKEIRLKQVCFGLTQFSLSWQEFILLNEKERMVGRREGKLVFDREKGDKSAGIGSQLNCMLL